MGIVSFVKYEDPPHLERADAEAILAAGIAMSDAGYDANAVLIGLALYDDDQDFVERWCVRVGREAIDPWLRGSAALSAGHLARRFRSLQPETREMVQAVAADPQVDGRKYDAVDDLRQFLTGRS
jgi:hypothetical protein